MVVSKDTNIKLVYNLICMFRFITLRACLHEGGRPKVGQVTRLGVHIISHMVTPPVMQNE